MRLLDGEWNLSSESPISAVFLLAFRDDSILAARNERGWDIPGGHIENGENVEDAIARETLEEAGATFAWAEPFALISVPGRHGAMLFFATNDFELSTFMPTDDALDRAVMQLDEFMSRYCGPPEVLQWLVEGARRRLTKRMHDE